MKNILKYTSFLIVLLMVQSCSLDPTLKNNTEVSADNGETLQELIDGSYGYMADYRYMGRNMILAGEVRSDNMYSDGNSGRFVRWSRMALLDTDGDVSDLFQWMYATVGNANIIINSGDDIEGEPEEISHIKGEAYAVRAMAYFDMIRVFGQQYIDAGKDLGIPYNKEFKGEEGPQIPRGSLEDNIRDLKEDLQNAIQYMEQGTEAVNAANKTNLTIDAVYALMSRIGIYFDDMDMVLEASEQLMEKYELVSADDYINFWSNQSVQASSIFELAYSGVDNPGINGLGQIYHEQAYGDVVAFNTLVKDAEFSANDVRANEEMIGVAVRNRLRNLGKYSATGTDLGTDNIKVFRYAEVVLNYAEALFKTGDGNALEILNRVPNHRHATPYSNVNMENILKERRKELIFEGFRLFDLARTHQDIRDMDPETVNNHGLVPAGDNKFAMPIPQHDMDANSAMEQNPGY